MAFRSCEPCCEMKGMLSFLVLFLLSKRELTGDGIACELERRRGIKPNPGTIYPALKELVKKGYAAYKPQGKEKVYRLTPSGRRQYLVAAGQFARIFGDVLVKA